MNQNWTSKAGPRQTKEIKKALSAVSWEGKTYTELNGVKGVTEGWKAEHSSVLTSIGTPPRPEATALLETIGELYDWQITRENHKAILADLEKGLAELKMSRPVHDERRSPDEDADREQKNVELAAKREAAQAAEEVENGKKDREWLKEYPHLEPAATSKKSRWALAAANIRSELAKEFPGQVFTVKSDRFSMGCSVDIGWTDGPTLKEVEAITSKYQTSGFDGMTDRSYSTSTHWNTVFGGAKFVQEQRSYSDAHQLAPDAGYWTQKERTETSFYVKPERPAARAAAPAASTTGVTVTINEEKNGIEIRFPSKPSASVLADLKAHGWRWTRFGGCWYHHRNGGTVLDYARQLAGETAGKDESPKESQGPDLFDMAYEDACAAACGL